MDITGWPSFLPPVSDAEPVSAEQGAITPGKRKRTKGGCLTCRKRRIKCGEERPNCKNCIVSKRECKGYVPRVVFDPIHVFRHGLNTLERVYEKKSSGGVVDKLVALWTVSNL